MTRRRKILSAAVIFQIITAHLEVAVPAQAHEWREEPVKPKNQRALKAYSILKKMYGNKAAITSPGQPVLFGAYRVVTSGAA